MRVPTRVIYSQAAYQLNRLTNNLNEANGKVNTRINTCSDDPLGMNRVLNIESSLSALGQRGANIQQGQAVLNLAETSLDAMADQLLEVKRRCEQLANASAGPRDRKDAAASIRVYLDGLLDLANTRSQGGYVFGGDQNQAAPFSYDDPDNPTCVTYSGSSDATRLIKDRDAVASANRCGSEMFYEDRIVVDATNNQIFFREDPGTGEQNIRTLKSRIPNGTYSREELASVLEKTMIRASLKDGYGLGYKLAWEGDSNRFTIGTDGSGPPGIKTSLVARQIETVRISSMKIAGGKFPDADIKVLTPSALKKFTPGPEGTAPLTLTYGDDGYWTVKNDPGYGLPAKIRGDGENLKLDMNKDGLPDIHLDLKGTPKKGVRVSFDIVPGKENHSILPDLGFNAETLSVAGIFSRAKVAGSFTVAAGKNDRIDFRETLDGTGKKSAQLTAVIPPGVYPTPQAYARAVEKAMEDASAQSGSRVNYKVDFLPETKAFSIREDTDTGRQLKSLDLLFSSGTHKDRSAGSDLGFSAADVNSGPAAGDRVNWSLFDTLFHLKKALAKDDVDSIRRAITRLDNHYAGISSKKSAIGIAVQDLANSKSAAASNRLSLIRQRSDVRDADSVEAIMTLKAAQKTYEAALSASSKIMKLSLLDYM
ncbi:MAG: flagellar hook-associated protein 3 [Desulfobacterales bacterium]|nr:flagellar hook-associated protein 3 [Desulfobacterales bacterium]